MPVRSSAMLCRSAGGKRVQRPMQPGPSSRHGWGHDIGTGGINALHGTRNAFVSLARHPETVAFQAQGQLQAA